MPPASYCGGDNRTDAYRVPQLRSHRYPINMRLPYQFVWCNERDERPVLHCCCVLLDFALMKTPSAISGALGLWGRSVRKCVARVVQPPRREGGRVPYSIHIKHTHTWRKLDPNDRHPESCNRTRRQLVLFILFRQTNLGALDPLFFFFLSLLSFNPSQSVSFLALIASLAFHSYRSCDNRHIIFTLSSFPSVHGILLAIYAIRTFTLLGAADFSLFLPSSHTNGATNLTA